MPAGAADGSYFPKVHYENNGDTLVVESGGELAMLPGSTFTGNGLVTAAALKTSLKTGYVPLPLANMRLVSANDVVNLAGIGGVPAKNSDPIFERVNGATDKALRLKWAASSVVEVILGQFGYPPDLDESATLTIKLLAKMGGGTDTPTIALSFFENIGDTNAGGNTAAASSTLSVLSVVIVASDVGPIPATATIGLTPSAHGTDTFELYAAWVEYTRV